MAPIHRLGGTVSPLPPLLLLLLILVLLCATTASPTNGAFNATSATSMAWRSSSMTNDGLVNNLKRHGLVESPLAEAALRRVDRACFTLSRAEGDLPYMDAPQPIGYGATISAPHMHAMCLELLADSLTQPNARALDVGSGSGVMCALFAQMMRSNEGNGANTAAPSGGSGGGRVFGIEYVQQLADRSIQNLQNDPASSDLLASGYIQVRQGDGWAGWPEHAPFSAIHVGAAAASVPDALLNQLASPGRMIIPVGPEGGDQYLYQIDKDAAGKVTQKVITGVRYVPLVQSGAKNQQAEQQQQSVAGSFSRA